MDHRVAHDLGRALAKKATEAAFAAYAAKYAKYEPRLAWRSDAIADASFRVKGIALQGKVEVRGQDIVLELDVPLLLRPFKSKALEVIEREIRTWVDRAKRGEL